MILQADNKEKFNKKDIDSVNSTQLNISGLSVSYSDSTVLENVTLQLKKGEILGIAGESGSGKSTLIKAIIGLLPKEGHIDGGVIEYNGVDITGNEKCLKSLRGSNIGMIFQNTERAMCPVRTIKSQLYESIFSNEAVKDKRKAKRIIDEKAVHMLEQMNIKNAIKVLNSYPFELSGGMNQRVGIMMAMLMKPDLLLADEPTSALDVIAQRQVVDIFKDIKCSGDTSMIIVSHNINVVRELADKIIVMKSGRIVEYEDTEIIMNYPKQEYTKQLISAVPVDNSGKTVKLNNFDIDFKKVTFGYNESAVIKDMSFHIPQYSMTALVGKSGCGKSTLAGIITNTVKLYSGSVIFKGEDISRFNARKMRDIYKNMQMIYQSPVASFDPEYTLGKSVAEALRNNKSDNLVSELFISVGLSAEYVNKYPGQVSGGECQRAAIARALAVKPEFLICDEATSALDVTVQSQIIALIKQLQQSRKMTVLFISHDIALVSQICNKTAVMKDGKIIEYSDTDNIINRPEKEYTRLLIKSVL